MTTHDEKPEAAAPAVLYGVFIGIDHYPSADQIELPPLACAVNDAELVFETMCSSRYSTELVVLANFDATVANIRKTVEEIGEKLTEHDSFFLTFSGHGDWVATDDGSRAICLTYEYPGRLDHSEDQLVGGFAIEQIGKWLRNGGERARSATGPKNIVVVLDSCYSGVLLTPNEDTEITAGSIPHRDGACRGRRYPQSGLNPKTLDNEDLKSSDWPRGSNIAVICSTGGEPAQEVFRYGQGLFTYLAIQWWRSRLLSGRAVSDLANELHANVSTRIKQLTHPDPDGFPRSQSPVKVFTRGTVKFGGEGESHWPGFQSPVRRLPIDQLFPPQPMDGEFLPQFRRNAQLIRDALTAPAHELADSNVLVTAGRFMSSRFQVLEVAKNLRLDLAREERSLVCLGTESAQTALPFLCALGSWRSRRWGQFVWAHEPPLLDWSSRGLIDALVRRLQEERALVIVAFREPAPDSDASYFLEKCAEHTEIRLCLITHVDQGIPMVFKTRRHRRTYLLPKEPIHEKPAFFDISEAGLHSYAASPRVAFWLDTLGVTDVSPRQLMQMGENDAADIPVYLEILEGVFEQLSREPRGKDALQFLKVMSLMRLPRPQNVVEALFGEMSAGDLFCSGPSTSMESMLEDLQRYRLVDTSVADLDEPGDDSTADSTTKVYYVHNIIGFAAERVDFRQGVSLQRAHQLAARAYCSVISSESTGPSERPESGCRRTTQVTWPRAILAQQAIEHFLAGEFFEDATRALIDNWHSLLNAGYQEFVLKWSQRLISLIPDVDCLSFRLLLKMQTLSRQRQAFAEIADFHATICRRYEKARASEQVVSDELENCYWLSRSHLGDYFLAIRDYIGALKEFAACIEQGRINSSTETRRLALRSRIRAALCFALCGDFRRTENTIKLAQLEINELPKQEQSSFQIRLLAVETELRKSEEDVDGLYHCAYQTLSMCLKPSPFEDETETDRFGRAIARTRMAWACLLRGEYWRAWNHCQRARHLLNTRGIRELWWISETERIATLAIAKALQTSHEPFVISWNTSNHDLNSEVVGFLRGQSEEQMRHVNTLCEILGRDDTWRLGELSSALGQLHLSCGDRGAATDALTDALRYARQSGAYVLEGYVCESLGLLNPKKTVQFTQEAVHSAAALEIGSVLKRRLNNQLRFNLPELLRPGNIVQPIRSIQSRHKRISEDPVRACRSGRIAFPLRDEFRYSCRWPAHLRIESEEDGDEIDISGMAVDVSSSGACVVFKDELPEFIHKNVVSHTAEVPADHRMSIAVGSEEHMRVDRCRCFSLSATGQSGKWTSLLEQGYHWGLGCNFEDELREFGIAMSCAK